MSDINYYCRKLDLLAKDILIVPDKNGTEKMFKANV